MTHAVLADMSSDASAPSLSADSSTVKDNARQMTEQARSASHDLVGQARSRLTGQLDRSSSQAGRQASQVAQDLRSTAEQLRDQGQHGPARMLEPAADRVERLGSYLQSADGEQLIDELDRIGRQRPWALAGIGLAAGLALSRLLKASAPTPARAGLSQPSFTSEPQRSGGISTGLSEGQF